MEWVETTAKTVEEAKDRALDQLGVAADDAEFEVVEAPRAGLFGRLRGEARVRARVKPTPVRPKVDRRRGRRTTRDDALGAGAPGASSEDADAVPAAENATTRSGDGPSSTSGSRRQGGARRRGGSAPSQPRADERASPPVTTESSNAASTAGKEVDVMDEPNGEPVDVGAVRDAAIDFVRGLTDAFGFQASVEATVEGNEIEVRVDGTNLGVLIGPGGRTLLNIQDLVRVAAQRRLHDHETRLRIDVAGYREKRRAALERFAGTVAEQVRSTGVARSLDPMPSADRKVIHDTLATIDGVVSRSEGEDPDRRVVVAPTS